MAKGSIAKQNETMNLSYGKGDIGLILLVGFSNMLLDGSDKTGHGTSTGCGEAGAISSIPFSRMYH